jgi:hypothetical protein
MAELIAGEHANSVDLCREKDGESTRDEDEFFSNNPDRL